MKKKTEPTNLEELKKLYEPIGKKYELPEFIELNRQFDIEDASVDTDFLLRKIRKIILEKINDYLRFIELILNPSLAPMFFFKLVKRLDNKDKEILSKTYEILGNSVIESIPLDISYSEEKEAEIIKKFYSLFNTKIKDDLLGIIKRLVNQEDNHKKTNNGSYFG